MGESWGDLDAAEYQFEHGYAPGGNPWVVGAYATGNKNSGIRDYAINHNPLNYSDFGFDTTGTEVHADGEIWNGTQWSVRQALVKKYGPRLPVRRHARSSALRRRHARPVPAAAPPVPGQPALDAAGLRLVPAPAGRHRACSTPATPCSPPTGCASAAPTRR